ncbi:MAG: hypothetical protein AAF587_33815 [Bacteroidota bacterium]
MSKIKGREIQLQFLVKSAVAQKYYESLNMSYETEAARKKFNQDWIDLERLIEVMEAVCQEEVDQIKALRNEQ